MIQDIFPEKLDNHFEDLTPDADSPMLCFKNGRLLTRHDDRTNHLCFPRQAEFPAGCRTVYLFTAGGTHYFLVIDPEQVPEGYEWQGLRDLQRLKRSGNTEIFAVYTAFHLWKWYETSRFCGACGHETDFDRIERAKVCPVCGNRIYPRINPAVIVGIINGDSLLLTKYKTGFGHNALVAGFTEIGETLEETVQREVMEEVGLKVKNIRYYKSQPWGIALDILAGFYCEVDGDDTIRRDDNELKYAEWVAREDIVLQPTNDSLTNEMMKMFKEGKVRG